jgi:hypothetical protein
LLLDTFIYELFSLNIDELKLRFIAGQTNKIASIYVISKGGMLYRMCISMTNISLVNGATTLESDTKIDTISGPIRSRIRSHKPENLNSDSITMEIKLNVNSTCKNFSIMDGNILYDLFHDSTGGWHYGHLRGNYHRF